MMEAEQVPDFDPEAQRKHLDEVIPVMIDALEAAQRARARLMTHEEHAACIARERTFMHHDLRRAAVLMMIAFCAGPVVNTLAGGNVVVRAVTTVVAVLTAYAAGSCLLSARKHRATLRAGERYAEEMFDAED